MGLIYFNHTIRKSWIISLFQLNNKFRFLQIVNILTWGVAT